MSLRRFVYYSGVIGGWMALLAWALAEAATASLRAGVGAHSGRLAAFRGPLEVAIVGAIVGAAISAGLNALASAASGQWKNLRRRLPAGLIGGGLGGTIGGAIGQMAFAAVGLPRAAGWMIMGLAIGAVDGLCERSASKLRNGLIGGGLGGLLGGWLFDRIAVPEADMAARATAFVILGVSVGALIGLAQVVLKEAWLTVLDGFQPGRELILSQAVTVLGRGDHLPLPLLGYAGRDLESEHARITWHQDGSYLLEDNRSRIGTLLNGRPVQGATALRDGDSIKLGGNIVRFNQRHGRRQAPGAEGNVPSGAGSTAIAPPPPPPAGSARPAASPPPLAGSRGAAPPPPVVLPSPPSTAQRPGAGPTGPPVPPPPGPQAPSISQPPNPRIPPPPPPPSPPRVGR